MPGKNANLRNKYQRRRLAMQFKERCRSAQLPCHLCSEKINYSAPPSDPLSFEADHYHPIATHPHLAFSMANLRPSHSRCNRARQADTMPTASWVKPSW